jgi:hypothetical protein
MRFARNTVLEVVGAVVTEVGVFVLWQVLGLIPSWVAVAALVVGITVWIALYFLYKPESTSVSSQELGSMIRKWLSDHGWEVQDFPPNPIDTWHFIIKTELGYVLETSLQKGKDSIGVIAAYRISPSHKAKLDKMSSEEIQRFYFKLQTEMAQGQYDWDVDPRVENPNVIIPLAIVPREPMFTKTDFIRAVEKVLKGLTLVIGYFNSELGKP